MAWILGGLSAVLTAAVAFGVQIPVIGNGRAAFVLLTVMGFAMCQTAMKLSTYGWTNIFNLMGIVLGSIALLLTVTVLFRISVPLIPSDRVAILAMAGIMVVKVAVALVRGAVA